MPYDPTKLVQSDPPPSTYDRVRDLLGVDTTTLSDLFLGGLPYDKVLRRANRYVPTWAALTQSQQADFAPAVVEALAAECVQRLQTLYAPGERSFAEQSGNYDWPHRRALLRASAAAGFSRTQSLVTLGASTATRQLLRAYGPSKDVPYVSPNPLKPLSRDPWGIPGSHPP